MPPSKRHAVYRDNSSLEQARAAFIQQDYKRSLRLFEKCAKQQPNNIMALTDAARAFGQRYEIEQALRYIRRIRFLAGQDPRALFLAGQSLRMVYRSEEAITVLQKAARRDAPPDTHLELAVLFERRHRLDEALEEVEQFLHASRGNPEGTLLKARILRRQNGQAEAGLLYEELSTRTGCATLTRAQALNEWANLLDAQQDYGGAITKLLESKALLQVLPESAQSTRQSELEENWLNHFVKSITPEHLAHWTERDSSQTHRAVLLTGCPRSGTTLIEKILDAHPELISADELGAFADHIFPGLLQGHRDEKGFFDADTLDAIPAKHLAREEARYTKHLQVAMDESIGSRLLIDKNPSLTFLIPATLRVWPQNRILYALRDPRDVALSCFFRWLPVNSVSVRFQRFDDTCKRTAAELDCWLKLRPILPPDRWLETRYEDTVTDHEAEARKILDWMHLPWLDSILDYRHHLRERGVNSPSYEAVAQPIHHGSIERWQHYHQHLSAHWPILESVQEQLGY